MSKTGDSSPLDAFTGKIEPTRVSPLYQFGLGVVTLAMVLLPLIYIALIMAMGKLVWWHIQNDVGIFEHVRGRGVILAGIVYLAPVIAGGIFILFLIKPLFSKASKPVPSYKITEADEPLLFNFVRKICELVGAPNPREIRLDTQVNASAGFRRGWWSFFGNDLVLVIGLPLAAGMTQRQLAGVLAHEFGHFAQGAGMRFSYIIRSVNRWFARVVYERDHWDDKLEEWIQTDSWWMKATFMLAKGGVWVGRKTLWCLMQLGHIISCFMSRQMEFDADSYEAKIAGSEEFARTATRLRALGAAYGAAIDDAYRTYQNKILPDDLPAMVLWREQRMPEEVRANMEREAAEAKTQWLHTHPADPDRIRAALALKASGVFHQESPASELFSSFDETCKAVTKHYFQHEQDIATDRIQFHSSSMMVQDRQLADDSDKNLDLFFGKNFHFMRVAAIKLQPPGMWRTAQERLKEIDGFYHASLRRYGDLLKKLANQNTALDLLEARFSLPQPRDFDLTISSVDSAGIAIQQTKQEITELLALMAEYETVRARRIGAALTWWKKTASEYELYRFEQLLTAQQALAEVMPNLERAANSSGALRLLFDNAANHSDGASLERQARAIAQRISLAANQSLKSLTHAAHPYLGGNPPVSDVLNLPEEGDNEYVQAFKLAQVCSNALIPLFVRIAGDLSGLALKAEQELEQTDLPEVTFEAPSHTPPPLPQTLPPSELPPPSLAS